MGQIDPVKARATPPIAPIGARAARRGGDVRRLLQAKRRAEKRGGGAVRNGIGDQALMAEQRTPVGGAGDRLGTDGHRPAAMRRVRAEGTRSRGTLRNSFWGEPRMGRRTRPARPAIALSEHGPGCTCEHLDAGLPAGGVPATCPPRDRTVLTTSPRFGVATARPLQVAPRSSPKC